MSTPSTAPSSEAAHLTRQQLDELDALLQRMLELPVHHLEEAPAATGPALYVLEAEPESPELPPTAADEPAPLFPSSAQPYPAQEYPSPSWEPASQRAQRPEPEGEDLLPEPLSIWWTPLVWGDYLFNAGARRLGKPGRWLRRPRGRTFLGWVGLLFLTGALALLIWDWIRTSW